MTAKEYLGQAYRIDQRINSKIEQVASLRELSRKATTTLSDMPKGTPNPHSKENIILKMMDLENEINTDIDSLVDLKREIVGIIKKVNNPEYQALLEERYLCFKPWEQIAVDMGYSTRYLLKIHSKALQACSAVIETTPYMMSIESTAE